MTACASGDIDAQPDTILIVIDFQLTNSLRQAAGGTFVPNLPTGPAPEMHLSGLLGEAEALFVQVRHHQYPAGARILDYFSSDNLWLEANLKAAKTFPDAMFLPGFWSEYGMWSTEFSIRPLSHLDRRRHEP